MDPLFTARLRQNWPILASFLLLVLFLLIDTLVFHPLAQRYQRALRTSGAMGIFLSQGPSVAALPPRVFTLLAENSLPDRDADTQGLSGQLAAQLMQDLSQTAGRHGLELVVTEPGVLTQQAGSVQVRAHLTLRGRYASLVGFLDDLSRSGRLYRIEKLVFSPDDDGRHQIDMNVERLVLKRVGTKP